MMTPKKTTTKTISLSTILLGLAVFSPNTLAATNENNPTQLENLLELLEAIIPLSPSKDWLTNGTTTPSATPTTSSSSSSSTTPSNTLRPTSGTTWNIQLSAPPSPSLTSQQNPPYKIWDIDLADSSPSLISSLHAQNHSVICYFSAGSWEKYRSDAGDFPEEALGNVMEGWPDERWVDVRHEGVREVMRRRIAEGRGKGCEGVDADNIDAYANDSGFDLNPSDAIDYIHFLSRTAHEAGLSYGLKNGGDIVPQVLDVAEWVVQEQCVKYEECELYRPFIEAGKAVFHLEYVDDEGGKKAEKGRELEKFVEESCRGKGTEGFSTLVKKLSLDEFTEICS